MLQALARSVILLIPTYLGAGVVMVFGAQTIGASTRSGQFVGLAAVAVVFSVVTYLVMVGAWLAVLKLVWTNPPKLLRPKSWATVLSGWAIASVATACVAIVDQRLLVSSWLSSQAKKGVHPLAENLWLWLAIAWVLCLLESKAVCVLRKSRQ